MDDFYVGDWLVQPALCRLSRDAQTVQVRAKVMDLLGYLASRGGEVVSKESLLDDVWGAREISESALTRTVTELRHALGDDVAKPRFLETIPKRGYRFIAPVRPVPVLRHGTRGVGAREPELAAVEAPLGDPCAGRSGGESVLSRLTKHTVGVALVVPVVLVIAGSGWWMSRARVAPSDPRSVAVLPFRTIGPGDGYFADGLTEAITTELGSVGGVRVIASNTAFEYRNQRGIRKIANDLGVGLVVRGSVQRAGATVRVDVSLIDTRDERALWSEHYTRDQTQVLSVQEAISRQIAAILSQNLGADARPASARFATTSADAYDRYLRGLWHLKGRSPATKGVPTGGARRLAAIHELERAVAHDSDFAPAHAALASAYTQRFFYDSNDPSLEQQAFLEIHRALALNTHLAEAYLARAQLTWNFRNGFPHEQAIDDLHRAVSINPNLAEAYVELGKVYFHIGLTDKAIQANDKALRLDPSETTSRIRRFLALVDAGRIPEVRHELDRDGVRLGAYPKSDALVAMGRLDEALGVLSASSSEESNTAGFDRGPQFDAFRAVVYARLGRRDDAERMLTAAIPAAENPTGLSHVHHAQYYIGATLALLGRHDEAVQWLTKAAYEGYPSYPRFSTDRNLAPLHGHAGFRALLEALRRDWDRWRTTL